MPRAFVVLLLVVLGSGLWAQGPLPPAPIPEQPWPDEPPAAERLYQARVNTLWVVPELELSWVEPLIIVRKPGGRRYQIDSNISEFTIARSLREAVDWLRNDTAHAPGFAEAYAEHDLLYYWPDEAQPRGGPSAGLAFALGGYAAMLELPIRGDVAVTGAIDSAGNVRPVAGLPLKIQAARAATMRTLIVPADSQLVLEELDARLCEEVRIVEVRRIEEAFFEAFGLDGPNAGDYDRLLLAWEDFRRAKAGRDSLAAAMALDDVLAIQPADLSAQRLRQTYARLDFSEAGARFYEQAQTYQHDGLPDEALRAVRRAWQYADEATRLTYRSLRERLEWAALSAEDRETVQAAEAAEAAGDALEAWRLLASLSARQPHNPYLRELANAWPEMETLAATAAAAATQPDNLVLQEQLAEAYRERALYESEAQVWSLLAIRRPSEVRWSLAEAAAWHRADRPMLVASVLRVVAEHWPDQAAEASAELGVELEPPTLSATQWRLEPGLWTVALSASDPAGPPLLGASLDGLPAVPGPRGAALLQVEPALLAPGAHRLEVSAVDAFGNRALLDVDLPAAAPEAGACLTPAADSVLAPPADLWLASPAAGETLAGATPIVARVAAQNIAGTRLTVYLDGQPWASGPAGEPLVLRLEAVPPGPRQLSVGTNLDGRELRSESITVIVAAAAGPAPAAEAAPGAQFVLPVALGEVLAPRPGPPVVRAALPGGGLRWLSGTALPAFEAQPAAVDTALLVDPEGLPAAGLLRLALGDRLAFATAPGGLPEGAELVDGPLGRRVWQPAAAGTWTLDVAGRPLEVTVTPLPEVAVWGVPGGAALRELARLRLSARGDVARVALFLGDQCLGDWPSPPPPVDLDPAQVSSGWHLLRAVGYTPDGAVVIGPPLAAQF